MSKPVVKPVANVKEDVARLSAERDARLAQSVRVSLKAVKASESGELKGLVAQAVNLVTIGIEVQAALASGDVKSVSAYAKHLAALGTPKAWSAYVQLCRDEAGNQTLKVNVPRGMTVDRAYRLAVAVAPKLSDVVTVETLVSDYVNVARDLKVGSSLMGFITNLTGAAADAPKSDKGTTETDETDDETETTEAPFSAHDIAVSLCQRYSSAQVAQIVAAIGDIFKAVQVAQAA